MLHCRATIEMAPLQIYRSALIYSPYQSLVRGQYGHLISEWSSLESVDTNWSPLIQTLQNNGSCEEIDVALSSDGKLVASSTGSVWDTKTGTLLKNLDTNGQGHAVTFSPIENHVVIRSLAGEIEVWDVPTGSLVRKIEHLKPPKVNYIPLVKRSLTPDKFQAAYSLGNGIIVFSDIRQSRVTDLGITPYSYSKLALSPDGDYLAIAGDCKSLQVYETNSGGLVHDFTEDIPRGYVFHVAFSYDGRFVTAANSIDISIWNMETLEVFKIHLNHEIEHIAFSPVGGFLCVSSKFHRVVEWWDWASQTLVRSIKSDHGVRQFSQDGNLCALLPFERSSTDSVPSNQIGVWKSGSGECPKLLDGHSKPALSVSFSRNASLLASISDDGTVRLWDLMGQSVSRRSVDIDLETVTRLYISPCHKHVVASDGENISLWNHTTDVFLKHVQTHNSKKVAYSPNGLMYAYTSHSKVIARDMNGGKEIHTLSSGTHKFSSDDSRLVFSADSEFLAHGYRGYSKDNWDDQQAMIEIWEVRSGTSRALLDLENHRCSALALSKDVDFVAAAIHPDSRIDSDSEDSDETGIKNDSSVAPCRPPILIWKLSDGNGDISSARLSISKIDEIYYSDGPSIVDLEWSPDGKVLASINDVGEIILWEISTQSLMAYLAIPYDFPIHWRFEIIAFSPDNRYLAAACSKGPTTLWDMSTRELIGTRQIGAEKHSLRFSADGRTIETSMGRLDVESFYPEPRRSSHLDFAVEDNWVLFGQEKAVLLHHDYQPTCAVVAGDVLVMGHESGRISYLRRN